MKRLAFAMLSLVIALLTNSTLSAQTNPWLYVQESEIQKKNLMRDQSPRDYKTVSLDLKALRSLLSKAPLWETPASLQTEVTLQMPTPDGDFQSFRVEEAPVMAPELAAKYPEIKSYRAYGIDDPAATMSFSLSPEGFNALVLSGTSSTIYHPYQQGKNQYYMVYHPQHTGADRGFECATEEFLTDASNDLKGGDLPTAKMGDCQKRTYRLAMACTGEFSQMHGSTTVAASLAVVNSYVTNINCITLRDLGVFFQLVPNNDLIIYVNPTTDPFTSVASNGNCINTTKNDNICASQNSTNSNTVIGSANYDIGHVLGTSIGAGGVSAGLGTICGGSKANAFSGIDCGNVNGPINLQVIVHEMGHQMGANHCYNSSNCVPGQYNSETGMDVAAGTTAMSYTRKCTGHQYSPSNPSDPCLDMYYHAISIQEILGHLTHSTNSCASITPLGTSLTANAGPDYTIPVSTPFVLTGTSNAGSGATFCWEQMDNAVAPVPLLSTTTDGPAFRSYYPNANNKRYFPRLEDLVSNNTPQWEVLPSVSRNMNFRYTVRSGSTTTGCIEEDDTRVRFSAASGPFVVNAPNTAVNWSVGSLQTITWSVANTNLAPVNCALVDIYLSTDGGFTYPITLASATPNDGSHTITVPSYLSSTARVMVRGNGNIFFDISNANFTISQPANTFSLAVTNPVINACAQASVPYIISIGKIGNFTGSVSMSVSGLPTNATASFSPSVLNSPSYGQTTLTISNLAAVASGSYDITITATGGTSKSYVVTLNTATSVPTVPTLASPANGSGGSFLRPTLTWNAATRAMTYEVQVSKNSTFTSIVASATGLKTTSFAVTGSLDGSTVYYWRVRAVNPCGSSSYSSTFSFTTNALTCAAVANTTAGSISSFGLPTLTRTFSVAGTGRVADVNITGLNISHAWINDLVVNLTSPSGKTVTLLSQICGNQDNVILALDDEATNPYASIPCPPTSSAVSFKPEQLLSAFDGELAQGTWTLTIKDLANSQGGTFNSATLQVCFDPNQTLQDNSPALFLQVDDATGTALGNTDKSLLENGIDISKSNIDFIRAYPNPVDNQLFVDFEDLDPKGSVLTITDMLGNRMLTRKIDGETVGSYTLAVDVSELAPGHYVLNIKNSKQNRSVKFIVQ